MDFQRESQQRSGNKNDRAEILLIDLSGKENKRPTRNVMMRECAWFRVVLGQRKPKQKKNQNLCDGMNKENISMEVFWS